MRTGFLNIQGGAAIQMNLKKIQLLFLLNGAIVSVNILLFSKAFWGLDLFEGTTLSVSVAWASILISLVVFIGGNNQILGRTKPPHLLAQKIFTLNDCVAALRKALHQGDIFDVSITKNIEQIERFKRKRGTIKNVLLQKFSAHEMSFLKFNGVLEDIENVICMNVRSILNKMAAIDIVEYEATQRKKLEDDELTRQRKAIYSDYIVFVNNATKTNESILLKLDQMLLEISRYNSLEDGDVQRLPAIMEMDELIQNAKLYK